MSVNPEDNEGDGDNSELLSIANSLTTSPEAMSALGSAIAEALRRTQVDWQREGRPFPPHFPRVETEADAMSSVPRGLQAPSATFSGARAHWSTGFPPAPPAPAYPWPYPGHWPPMPPPHQPLSPLDRLGPPRVTDSQPLRGGTSSPSLSSRAESQATSLLSEEEGSGEEEDMVDIHPHEDDFDTPGQGISVPQEVESFLKGCVAAPLTNTQRKGMLEKFPRPQVQEVRPPKLDPTLKLLVPKSASGHDGWLQKMQALALDAYGPLVSLLGREEDNVPSYEETKSAIRCSLKLMGNLFARLSQERRRKALCAINKDLGHMADEKFGSGQSLFGDKVVDRIKARHEAIKSLKQAKQPFRKGGAQKAGQSGRREGHGHPSRGKQPPFKRGRYQFAKGNKKQT